MLGRVINTRLVKNVKNILNSTEIALEFAI